MKDPDRTVSRRTFLLRMSYAAGAASVFASCGSDSPDKVGAATAGLSPGNEEAFSCTDVSNLTAEQVQMRKTLKYVDDSPHTDKRCNNCQLFKKPADGEECGTCQVVPGPIHPKGHCSAWVASTG